MEHVLDPDPETRWTMARTAEALRAVAVEPPAEEAEHPTRLLTAPRATPDKVPDPVPDPVPDTVPRPIVATAPPRRRSRGLLGLGLVALIALGLLAAGGWWLTRDPGGEDGAARDRSPAGGRSSAQSSAQPSAQPSGRGSASATPSLDASSSDPASGSTTAGAAPSAGSASELVTSYYEALPEDTGAAWALLTPALQDRIGRSTFDGFWATIDDVRVDEADEVGDGLVRVSLTYTTDGRSERETRELAVESVDGGLLVSEDRGAV
jgi:hypothetical protein